MPEELEDPKYLSKVVALITSACPEIHSILYLTSVELRIKDAYMKLNMKTPYKGEIIIKFPVQYVWPHHVQQC